MIWSMRTTAAIGSGPRETDDADCQQHDKGRNRSDNGNVIQRGGGGTKARRVGHAAQRADQARPGPESDIDQGDCQKIAAETFLDGIECPQR